MTSNLTPDTAAALSDSAGERNVRRQGKRGKQPQGIEFTPEVIERINAAAAEFADRPGKRNRRDGWTGEAQRIFLEAIAGGDPVDYACRQVGMTRQAAYAFRTRAHGAAFAAAWDACVDMARFSYGDFLMQRVIEGVEIETRSMDGRVSFRRHYDHRLGMALLNRMDKMADARAKKLAEAASINGDVNRDTIIARHWGDFLDGIEQADVDNRDSDESLVAAFIAEHIPETEDAAARQNCQLVESSPAGTLNELDHIDIEERVERSFREAEDGSITTCLGAPKQVIANPDDPHETENIVPDDAWRPATAEEIAVFRAWQIANTRLPHLDAQAIGCDLLTDMNALAQAVSAWAEELTSGEATAPVTKPNLRLS